MKPVRSLPRPPNGLQAFRDAFPDERNWTVFKNYDGSRAYRELLDRLVLLQHGLCCYCEVDLLPLDWQVEHFLPKGDRTSIPNNTIEPSNLLAGCCGGSARSIWGAGNDRQESRDPVRHRDPTGGNLSCGQAKGDGDPAAEATRVIDPRSLPPEVPIITVSTFDGSLAPHEDGCRAAGLDAGAVRQTIVTLNLNCERLRVARADRLRDLAELYNDMDVEVLLLAAGKELLPDADGRLVRFFSTARVFFAEAAEVVLARSERWV